MKLLYFPGSCPFLTCTVTEGHTHPCCPDCGAARYGNFSCSTCRATRVFYPNPVFLDSDFEEED